MRYQHFMLFVFSMLLMPLFFAEAAPSRAIQAPQLRLDMVTAGNTYNEPTNTMNVGPIDQCLETPAPGNIGQHNHTAHLAIHDVEDLIGWQARLNYDGGRMRPLSINFTPFTDNTTGQNVSIVNLPIDAVTGVHRDITAATSIPPQAPGPQSALIGSVYIGEQAGSISADTPAKAPPDDASYSAPSGGVLAAVNLQVLAGQTGQSSLYVDLDDSSPNAPGSSLIVFTETGSASIDLAEADLGDGFHGEGAPCVPIAPPPPPPVPPLPGSGAGIAQADYDGDGFDDTVENRVGTDPVQACGINAWPADIYHDRFVDMFDIARLTGSFGKQVPPAPARYNIAPDWPNTVIDTADIARLTGLFNTTCEPFGVDADDGTYARTGTPFGGWWDRFALAHPATHHVVECEPPVSGIYPQKPANPGGVCGTQWGFGDWSIDYYGPNRPVIWGMPFTSAPLTAQVWAIYPTCSGTGGASVAGSTIFADIYVGGRWQGWRSFGHLDNIQVSPGQTLTPSQVLGYTRNWGNIANCYEVQNDDGVHIHYEEFNTQANACYWSYTSGQFMNFNTNFGTIGRTIYSLPRQPC